MTRSCAMTAFLACLALLSPVAMAQEILSPKVLFEGALPTGQQGGGQPAQTTSVKSWELPSKNEAVQDIPLTGFYVAHLLSGRLAATVDGQTSTYEPGSYWTVKTGATMQVKVLGEMAVLETIAASKQ
jgi:quercetin dioxygenase-like cupin family protein